MRRPSVCLSMVTAAAGLVGCGGTDATEATTAPVPAPTVSVLLATPAPPITPPAPRPGPGVEVATAWGSVTYFGQQRPAATGAPAPQQAGTEWVAIDVQTCLDAGQSAGELWNSAWTVTDAGNGLTEPSSVTYDQFPAPQYPIQAYFEPSTCVRGWIVYPIVTGRELTRIRYLPDVASVPLASWRA